MTREEAVDKFITDLQSVDPFYFHSLNFNKPGALRMLWQHYIYHLYKMKLVTKQQLKMWQNPIEPSWVFMDFQWHRKKS